MAQLFTLKVTDNTETVDFISSPAGPYYVQDGGFDIGLPEATREIQQVRPGFFAPVTTEYGVRKAELKFEIRGSTRSIVIAALNKLERILRNVSARSRITNAARGELSYAWEGATNITYFEVFGGDLAFDEDILSVEKAHRKEGTDYAIGDITLTLYLSQFGYGVSIYSNTLTEVPLANPSYSKRTGGIAVKNPGTGNYNWVEIDGTDLANTAGLKGAQPLLTKISVQLTTGYSGWQTMYMGLQKYPFPSTILFDDADLAAVRPGTSTVTEAYANGGYYRSVSLSPVPLYDTYASYAWSVGSSTTGLFYAFQHGYANFPSGVQAAVGVDDYVSFGVRYRSEFIQPACTTVKAVPLGPIQLPPGSPNLANYGTIDTNLELGIWLAADTAATYSLDYLSLLPITHGFRVWRSRVVRTEGIFYDDGWQGIEYFKDASNNVSIPFFGLMSPLKLEPNVTQRIYFTSIGAGNSAYAERMRIATVRVYAVPTFLTLAE